MTVIRTIAAAALLASGIAAATPAAAVITTFANYSGVGGANLYWKRSGTNYVVAVPVHVNPVHVNPVVVVAHTVAVTGTPAQKAAKIAANNAAIAAAVAANAANVITANNTNTANINAAAVTNAANIVTATNQTAASAASADATAGGQFYTIHTSTSTTPGSVATHFSFLSPGGHNPLQALAALGALNANFTFLGTAAPGTQVNPSIAAFGFDVQPLTSGTFSFIYTGAANLVVHHTIYHTGANLLTAIFTKGAIVGDDGATSGAAADSTAGANAGMITYTSDFLSFLSTNRKDYAISATSITAPLGFGTHQALNTFKATTTGSFSTDPQPTPTAIVPEPAMWGLMVVGFGMVGFRARRRARAIRVTA